MGIRTCSQENLLSLPYFPFQTTLCCFNLKKQKHHEQYFNKKQHSSLIIFFFHLGHLTVFYFSSNYWNIWISTYLLFCDFCFFSMVLFYPFLSLDWVVVAVCFVFFFLSLHYQFGNDTLYVCSLEVTLAILMRTLSYGKDYT